MTPWLDGLGVVLSTGPMGPLSNLAARLEKAASFHFHVHLGFNLQEFLQSLDGDVANLFRALDDATVFMDAPGVCEGCGGSLDLESPDTIGADYDMTDGTEETLYWHEKCAPPEHVEEANEGLEDADDDG